MNLLSDRVLRMEESKTIMMARLTRQLKAQGKDVITLSLGDLDFNTPDYIKLAAKKAIDDNFSHYPPVEGFKDLLQAIRQKFFNLTGYWYDFDQILVSNGAKHSLANVILATVNPGDQVILPVPYWVTYNELINLAGGKQIYLKTSVQNHFKITPEQLESAITPKTKLIIFNNPNNPTGTVYSYGELKALAQVLAKHPHVLVIADEVYDQLVFDNQTFVSLGSFDQLRQQLILINGVSKTYAMTGWRVGFMAGPKWLIKACKKLQGQMTSGVNAIAQKAAAAALSNGTEIISNRKKILQNRRDLIVSLLKQIPNVQFIIPKGSFYIFPIFNSYIGKKFNGQTISSTTELSMFLLEHALVATVAGEAFGFPGALRLSFAIDEKIISTAMQRIKKALSMLT